MVIEIKVTYNLKTGIETKREILKSTKVNNDIAIIDLSKFWVDEMLDASKEIFDVNTEEMCYNYPRKISS